jgi:hypothetical protein
MASQTQATSVTSGGWRKVAAQVAFQRPALALPVALLAFIAAFFVGTDPDYWWHARTGHHILDTRTFPRADIFSYTAEGRPWVAHEWLSEVLFAWVERGWGYAGNALLFGLVSALIVACAYATCRLRGLGEVGGTLIALWGLIISFPVTNWRPQILTTALLAAYALLLTHYRRGHARALWPLPALMILWVNLHGGYVIGLVLLGLTFVGELWEWLWQRAGAPPRALFLACLLSFAATLVSPLGLEALRYPFLYAGADNFAMRFIADFQSPDFHQTAYLPLAFSLLLALVVGIHRRPLGPVETLWVVVFALMALQSVRHVQLYAVVALPLIGVRLAAESPALPAPLARRRRLGTVGLMLLLWLLPVLGATAALGAARGGTPLQLRAAPSAAGYPVGAADYLLAHHPPGNLFNEYHWGGYLIYRLYPARLVFIDGRADVYGDAFVAQYQQLTRLQIDWRQRFAEYDIRLALVGKESALALALAADPNWREVYVGDVERLFERHPPTGHLPTAHADE